MQARCLSALIAFVATGAALHAQDSRRKMTFVGGLPDRGKCTVEVVVDGVAEVEIFADTGRLRNLSGNPPQWRRLECSGPLPRDPVNFRFAGVDGRGVQMLVHDPRNGSAAVIRIGDPQGGAEGYTFDIFWANGPQAVSVPRREDGDRFYRDRTEAFRGDAWRARVFQRIREDLEHVRSVTFPIGGDQHRIERATRQLDQLQTLLADGRYDSRQLDDVVRSLRTVLADNRLLPRDRDILSEDLDRLRDFRSHLRDYGVR